MTCPECGTENRAGRKFCSNCGSVLARSCPACGAANEPDDRFCGDCGAPLETTDAPVVDTGPVAERRLVSVLFGDLVGFTPLSEDRDPEEVRELLSRYFDTARRVIERYGGTVEKFIGDAVMAVWGTPVAREDDPERAVRAALELVEVVAGLEAGIAMRAGAVTGEAAVTVGAAGEGMVAGDLVNTASRVQAAAQPGTVLVGERTRRASEAAIQYEGAGEHKLKGKSEPLPLWQAVRVIAARGGEGRGNALEPPFVGRDSELRLIKDLFHAAADENKARLVSVLGIAGIGKTRLSWEFEKYVDGLAADVYWHRGRCLAYGEGVAFWALAEMVRMRAGIAEQEEPTVAARKLHEAVEQHIADLAERAWVEATLAQLLGLGELGSADREDLYAGWRLFFERLSEQSPTVLVFEDLQWADAALLDFVQYLLDWSRNHPMYVLAIARPELAEKQVWGGATRDFTSISLEPLAPEAMGELLGGLVPGLPEELRDRIRDRAEGVPLYAVETVRMLLDRGLLRREGDQYVAAEEVESLEVPETLHGLIAARLDGLEPRERAAVDDAAVLGKTFTKAALAALTGLGEDELVPILSSLVRKDLLTMQTDPRSPERGNYGFLQALVQRIAYETLARKERKARHLAAARHFEHGWGSEDSEIVEVIASHYLDAYRADPEAPDAAEIRVAAREALVRAGRRAASVAANEEAQRYLQQAADLAVEESRLRAELLEEAGSMAEADNRNFEAIDLFEEAIALCASEGLTHTGARVEAKLGFAMWNSGQIDKAAERMQRSFAILAGDEPDEDLAMLAAQLARFRVFMGDSEDADEPLEFALDAAEARRLPHVVSEALNTKSLILARRGRPEESLALLRHALELALENDLTESALRAYFNLAYLNAGRDRLEEAIELDEKGLELARRRGKRHWEQGFLGHLRADRLILGEWDGLESPLADPSEPWENLPWQARLDFSHVVISVALARGRIDEAQQMYSLFPDQPSAEVQERASHALGRALIARAQGRYAEALAAAEETLITDVPMGPEHPFFKHGFAEALEAALALGNLERAETLLGVVRGLAPVERVPLLEAQATRFAARLATIRGESSSVDNDFKRSAALLREIGARFWLAVVLLEHGEWLAEARRGEEAEPLLDEAGEIFERLEAAPWVERLHGARARGAASTAAVLGSG